MKRLLTFVAAALVAAVAAAQPAWPTKPVRFIVPFTPGSATDIVSRAVADVMAKGLGQPVFVDNKPGAGGTIGANLVAHSDPDGYTVLIPSSGHVLNPAIYPHLPYDTVKDLTGVTALAALPNVLVVSPTRGWNSLADLVAAAKANPGKLNFATAGIGSAAHMNTEKFKLLAAIQATHVPYKGTPEALTDIMAGRTDFFFAPLVGALPLIKEGKLRALAVSSPQRSPALPDVPTTIEAGVPGSDYLLWVGMIVPAATPPEVVRRLHDEAVKALATQQVQDRLSRLGAQPLPMQPEQFNAFIRTEMDSAAKVARAASLKAQ